MLLTHRFDSAETLTRARYWLTTLGFEVANRDASKPDSQSLALVLDFSRASAARALIRSIEQSDPVSWPEFDGRLATSPTASAANQKPTAVGWHSHDDHSADDAISCKVCEYMLSRWE